MRVLRDRGVYRPVTIVLDTIRERDALLELLEAAANRGDEAMSSGVLGLLYSELDYTLIVDRKSGAS